MSNKVLVSWIGHNDLLSMAGDISAKDQKKVLEELGRKTSLKNQLGPIKTLLEETTF